MSFAESEIGQVSFTAADYSSMYTEIVVSRRVQQQVFSAFTVLNKKCEKFKSEADTVRIDAECAHARPDSSASKVSLLRVFIGGIGTRLTRREVVIQEPSENSVTHLLSKYFV